MTGCSNFKTKDEVVVEKPKYIYTCPVDDMRNVMFPIIKGKTNEDIIVLILDYEAELKRLDIDINEHNQTLEKINNKD